MKDDVGKDGLRQGLESVIALESRLEQRLTEVLAATKGYLDAPGVIGRLQPLATRQREALQAHLGDIGDSEVLPAGPVVSAAFEGSSDRHGTQADNAIALLRGLATALTEAAFAYVVLHALAHRSYQVATANLADEHRRSYMGAAQAIHQAAGDVAVQELGEAGHVCRCECPSCSPGICLCWHVHTDPELTGLGVATEGIMVRVPRPGSNAERAGLRHGDAILAVSGKEVRSYQDMLDRMRDHQPGEEASLRVRRGVDEPQELIITR